MIFWGVTLMAIAGKAELTIDKYGGRTFTGVGKLGISRKFVWDEISKVRETRGVSTRRRGKGYHGKADISIVLEGQKRISFASGVSQERRYYLYRTIQQVIQKVKANQNF